MPTRLKVVLVAAILVVATFLDAALPEESQRPRTPISVVASTTGRFAQGLRSWHLSVNSARRAHLTISSYPKPQSREFDIAPEQINQLSELLDKEQFFNLKGEYGERVVDGSTDTITIVRGDVARTVSIHFLMNWVDTDPSKLREPARAVRVFGLVRTWFDDKDAVNLKRYDDILLKAADKGG
jgi:hypothetical protein